MTSNSQNSTYVAMFFLALLPWQMAFAVPAPPEAPTTSSTTSYHYGYDDGRRSALLQLYDGLSVQKLIQSTPGSGFITDPLLDNQELKDLTVSLIQASTHLTSLQAMEPSPVFEALEVVLREVMHDGCRYFHEVMNLPQSFQCTPMSLSAILSKIELAEHINRARNLTYNLLPENSSIDISFRCQFWNTHVRQNCTVSSPALKTVQKTILEPKYRRGNTCTFCPTENCE